MNTRSNIANQRAHRSANHQPFKKDTKSLRSRTIVIDDTVVVHKARRAPVQLAPAQGAWDVAAAAPQARRSYQEFFSNPLKREQMHAFLNNVFQHIDIAQFWRIVDSLLTRQLGDSDFRHQLFIDISAAKLKLICDVNWSIKALTSQTADLADKLHQLLGDGKIIAGHVDIGSPGILNKPLAQFATVQKPRIVVDESQSLLDYVKAGFPLPRDRFEHLDYQPLTPRIAANSVDLVTCMIGIHHCPRLQLDAFIESIAQVLRVGGAFVLRDHLTESADLVELAKMVHMVFNAASGVDVFEDAREIRNFMSLAQIDALMERHGLVRDTTLPPLVRDGDSSQNAMVKYVKVGTEQERFIAAARATAGYARLAVQTHNTAAEIQNVRSATDYANFIHHRPWFYFSFGQEIVRQWQTFGSAFVQVWNEHGLAAALDPNYFSMNLFVTVFATVEFGIKSVIAAPLRWGYSSAGMIEPVRIGMVVNDPHNQLNEQSYPGAQVVASLGATKQVELPRYELLRDMLLRLSRSDVQLVDFAGNEGTVRVDVRVGAAQVLPELEGCKVLISKPLTLPEGPATDLDLGIKVAHLLPALRALQEAGIHVDWIHDF